MEGKFEEEVYISDYWWPQFKSKRRHVFCNSLSDQKILLKTMHTCMMYFQPFYFNSGLCKESSCGTEQRGLSLFSGHCKLYTKICLFYEQYKIICVLLFVLIQSIIIDYQHCFFILKDDVMSPDRVSKQHQAAGSEQNSVRLMFTQIKLFSAIALPFL